MKAKHYDCIRSFTDIFTTYRVEKYNQLMTREHLIRQFNVLHQKWGRLKQVNKPWFSYDWLLRKFLEAMNHPLVAYLKPPTAKRREEKYQNLYTMCMDE